MGTKYFLKMFLTPLSIVGLYLVSFPSHAILIKGPTSTYYQLVPPQNGYTDFHLVVDVTDGEPVIRRRVGDYVRTGNSHAMTSPTDDPAKVTGNPVDKNGAIWTYKWSSGVPALTTDTWRLGLELNTNNILKTTDAYWTKGGLRQQDKVALAGWKVAGKDVGGADPLYFEVINPYVEEMLVSDLSFLVPRAPLSLDDLIMPLSGSGLITLPGAFTISGNSSIEFLFDGSSLLPALDPGSLLAAEFTTMFSSAGEASKVITRIQHAVPEPLLLLGLAVLGVASRYAAIGARGGLRAMNVAGVIARHDA